MGTDIRSKVIIVHYKCKNPKKCEEQGETHSQGGFDLKALSHCFPSGCPHVVRVKD